MLDNISYYDLEKISRDALFHAAKIALDLKEKVLVKYKSQNQPVTQADIKIDDYLKSSFSIKTPNFGWLSEESCDDGSRLNSEFFWCLDPIDGTRSYINGKPEYTISLALLKNSNPLMGMILNPETEEFFFAKKKCGAFCNGKKISVNQKKNIDFCSYAISNSETKKLSEFSFINDKNVVKMGSIAYKIALVAKGKIDVALSFTRKNDWDLAAASLIIEEAGGKIKKICGNDITYNTSDLRIDSVIASNFSLFSELRKKLNRI